MSETTTILAKFIGSFLFLLIGVVITFVIIKIINAILLMLKTNTLFHKLLGRKTTAKVINIEKYLIWLVGGFVFLPFLYSAIQSLAKYLPMFIYIENFLHNIFYIFPHIVGFLILLFIAVLLARILEVVFRKLLVVVKLVNVANTGGRIIFWLVIILCIPFIISPLISLFNLIINA